MRKDVEETVKCIETYLEVLKMIFKQFSSKGFNIKKDGLLYESSLIASKSLDSEMKRLNNQRKTSSYCHEVLINKLLEDDWIERSKGFVRDGLLIDYSVLDRMSSDHIEKCGVSNIIKGLVGSAEEFGDAAAKDKLNEKLCPLCYNKSIGSDNKCKCCSTEYCEFCNGIRLVTPETVSVRDTNKVKKCDCG